MNLFPIIQPQITENESQEELKLYKEVKWDFEKNVPVFINGVPAIVSGKEAVRVWIWKSLNVPRYRHDIYTWDYGSEIESLIGLPFTEELKQSEATRYISECLLINPYITDVSNITITFAGEKLTLECVVHTVYGEVEIHV